MKNLLQEVKERGFKKGVQYRPHNSWMIYTIQSNKFHYGYYSNTDVIHADKTYGLIYDNGNWREIIEP